MTAARTEQLGEVTAPSGILLVLDTGYLRMWSHDQVPVMPEGILGSEESTAQANESVDIRIDGPDAEAAGRAFNRQWHPRHLFDIRGSRGQVDVGFREGFEKLCRENGLNAHLTVLPERVSHRRRVDLTLDPGGAGELIFHGVPAVAAAGIPRDRPLAIHGQRMPAGDHEERWLRVWVEVDGAEEVARSERVGCVGVDWARLIVADADALGAWVHDDSLDGLADFVFWGRDAETVARAVRAPEIGDGHWGWLDRPIKEIVKTGTKVEKLVSTKGHKVATDFRPHSHHHAAMAQTRTSATESSVVDVGGARLCNFMTTWGDGIFDVFRDVSADGRLVRIRVEMGTPDRVERVNALFTRS